MSDDQKKELAEHYQRLSAGLGNRERVFTNHGLGTLVSLDTRSESGAGVILDQHYSRNNEFTSLPAADVQLISVLAKDLQFLFKNGAQQPDRIDELDALKRHTLVFVTSGWVLLHPRGVAELVRSGWLADIRPTETNPA